MPQALSGQRRSVPKACKLLADDRDKLVYRKAGNNHAYPFLWGDKFTMISGATEVVLASGVKFHGYDLATYANVTASPLGDPVGRWYIDKNTTTNVIKIVSTSAMTADVDWDVKFMLGVDPDIEHIYCRGNRGAMPTYP